MSLMSYGGSASGTIKIITCMVDTSVGRIAYEDIVNDPNHEIIEEKIYGSSLGDIKIIIRYRVKDERWVKKKKTKGA
jgi:hypothetical protein